MRPSAGCNLPWPCTARLDRPLAPGWFWTKRRSSCWKRMTSCFRTGHSLRTNLSGTCVAAPVPRAINAAKKEESYLTDWGVRGAHYISSPLSWLGTLRAVSTNMEEVGWEMAQAEVRQKQEQHKLPSLGCGANSIAGHLARSIWIQQAEMPGCYRSTWWVTQEPSWQDQERGQPRNKESISSFPVSPRSSWRC